MAKLPKRMQILESGTKLFAKVGWRKSCLLNKTEKLIRLRQEPGRKNPAARGTK